jgi:hypothetical protein
MRTTSHIGLPAQRRLDFGFNKTSPALGARIGVIYDGLQHVEIYIFQLVYVEAATPTNSMFPQLTQFGRATKTGQIEQEGQIRSSKSRLSSHLRIQNGVLQNRRYSPPTFWAVSRKQEIDCINLTTTRLSTRRVSLLTLLRKSRTLTLFSIVFRPAMDDPLTLVGRGMQNVRRIPSTTTTPQFWLFQSLLTQLCR